MHHTRGHLRGRRARLRDRLLGTVAAVCTVVVMSTAPAQAGQHQDANEYALWAFHGANGFWNIDQRVQITRKAHHSYWAMLWDFTTTPGKGGYMGLQTNGTRFNHTRGETAIFSLWNANGSREVTADPSAARGPASAAGSRTPSTGRPTTACAYGG